MPASIDQHYDVAPEEYWRDDRSASQEAGLQHRIELFRTLWKPGGEPRQPVVLDIGVGLGHAMSAFARAGMDVYGIEPSASFRARAIELHGISPGRLRQLRVEEADYPASCFDFINFAAVVEHLYDPAAALQASICWLRPGGLIYVEVPSSRYLVSSLVRLLYRLTASEYVINLCPMHAPYHLYEFTLDSFQKNGELFGYRVAFHEYFACPPRLPLRLDHFAAKIMDATRTGMQLAVWLEKRQADSGGEGTATLRLE